MKIENYVWRVGKCTNEFVCWCAPILAITNKRGRDKTVIGIGEIHKTNAEMIVKIHNEWLEEKKQPSPKNERVK